MMFVTAATLGDFRYNESRENFHRGKYVSAFLGALRAEAVFPLKYYTRESVATMFHIADTLPPTLVLGQIDRVLRGDPNSPHLLWYKAIQHLRAGDLEGAKTTIEHLERVGKGWKQTENAKAVYLAVEKHVNMTRAALEHEL